MRYEKCFHASAQRVRVATDQLFDPSPQFGDLGALRSHELREQASREKYTSKQQADFHEREQRAESNARDDTIQNCDDAGQHADEEQPRAKYAEEQQRLARETQLEPDRQHVQHAHGNPAETELGFARHTWIQRDRCLANSEAAVCRDDDHVTMPVRTDRKRRHHFAPVRLDRIEIANRHVEQLATQSVVYARDERLLVLAFLSTRHHVELTSQNW